MDDKGKYRLCAVDMDGTLLNSENRITPATAEAIRKVSERGIYFCLTTGRPPIAVRPFWDSLGLGTPAIIYNGARIIDFTDGSVSYDKRLEKDAAERILALGTECGAAMCFWEDDKLYTNVLNKWSEQYREISDAPMELPDDVFSFAGKGIIKIVFCGEPEKIKQWNDIARERLGGSVSFASSGPQYLEFFQREVSKGAALRRLCDSLGVGVESTIAIGDSYNDEQLLSAAGLGVAMGNAPDSIKSMCSEVTETNDRDGVRLILEKYFL